MRILLEIVESAKDGQMPTHEECYWAMLVLDGLLHFETRALQKMVMDPQTPFNNPTFHAEDSFRRNKKAFSVTPKHWLGIEFDPANPEYQRMRRAAFTILDKVTSKAAHAVVAMANREQMEAIDEQ